MEKNEFCCYNKITNLEVLYVEKTKLYFYSHNHNNWSLIRENNSVVIYLHISKKKKSNWSVIHGKKQTFFRFLHTIKISKKYMEKNIICIAFHITKKCSVIHGKNYIIIEFHKHKKFEFKYNTWKQDKFYFLTKPSKLKKILHGKRTKFVLFLTKPQKMKCNKQK